MKPVEKSAFYLIPATALVAFGLRKIGSAVIHFSPKTVLESENSVSFIVALVLTVLATGSGLALIFRNRTGYFLSVALTGALAVIAAIQTIQVRAMGSDYDLMMRRSLTGGALLELAFLFAIFALLILKVTRSFLTNTESEQAADRKPNNVVS
ncbi:MAG: hypothetical protein AAGA96_08495 [Verrucomicrobiota bacterium]